MVESSAKLVTRHFLSPSVSMGELQHFIRIITEVLGPVRLLPVLFIPIPIHKPIINPQFLILIPLPSSAQPISGKLNYTPLRHDAQQNPSAAKLCTTLMQVICEQDASFNPAGPSSSSSSSSFSPLPSSSIPRISRKVSAEIQERLRRAYHIVPPISVRFYFPRSEVGVTKL